MASKRLVVLGALVSLAASLLTGGSGEAASPEPRLDPPRQHGTVGPIRRCRPCAAKATNCKNVGCEKQEKTDGGYFSVRVAGAYFRAPARNDVQKLYRNPSQVIVSSSTSIRGNDALAGGAHGITWTQDVQAGRGYDLGFRTKLADYIPEVGTTLVIDLRYMLVQQSILTSAVKTLVGASGDPALVGVLSPDPVTLATAQTIGNITARLVDSMFPEKRTRSELQFSGHWPIQDLQPGYYFILSTYEVQNLPTGQCLDSIVVAPAGDSYAELRDSSGNKFTRCSYVILEVTRTNRLGQTLTTEWRRLYEQASSETESLGSLEEADRDVARARIEGILNHARAVALSDTRYHPRELQDWDRVVRQLCLARIAQCSTKVSTLTTEYENLIAGRVVPRERAGDKRCQHSCTCNSASPAPEMRPDPTSEPRPAGNG